MTDPQKFDNRLDNTASREAEQPKDIAQPHPKQADAMKVFERIQQQRRFGVSVNIGDIANQLRGAAPRSSFPETLFVEHFLPLFAGEVEPTSHVNYTTWVEKVAGGVSSPVDITNEKGDVIYTVPAMFSDTVLEQTKPGAQAMTHIERQYSRLKEFDAAGSQRYLAKMLAGMHIKEKPTQEVYDNMRVWNDIFKRYGREDKIINMLDLNNDPNKDKPTSVGTVAGSSGNDDVGDYVLETD